MPATALKPEQLFTLDILAPNLVGYQAPQAAHDPAGDWTLSYRLHSLGRVRGPAVGGALGTVALTRKRLDDQRFSLQVTCQKPAGGKFTDKLEARIEARAERLPVAERWTWKSEIVDGDGQRVADSGMERSATAQPDALLFANPPRRTPIHGPWTLAWLLFEAIGRLPREPFAPLSFTLVDDFDQIKPGGALAYAQTQSVILGDRPVQQTRIEELPQGRIHKTSWEMSGGRPVPLHVYHQLGQGIVPWVYWVDDRGRPLLIVSGIEAYVLEAGQK